MKTVIVKDLMVPKSDYATISQEANLFEAVTALEEAQKKFDRSQYPHRAVLVFDKNSHLSTFRFDRILLDTVVFHFLLSVCKYFT